MLQRISSIVILSILMACSNSQQAESIYSVYHIPDIVVSKDVKVSSDVEEIEDVSEETIEDILDASEIQIEDISDVSDNSDIPDISDSMDVSNDSLDLSEIVESDTSQDATKEVIEEVFVPKCQDDDGDGYGPNCKQGPDCDDYNPNFATKCPDCSKDDIVGCACKVKSTSCFTGDPSAIGKGMCVAGIRLCKDGFWGECLGDILPETEVCNNQDDDCDGLTDEGVKSSCGTCDLTCNQQNVGAVFNNPFELVPENSSGVNVDANGNIVLDLQKNTTKFYNIWISNSPQNTVSKLDTKTGAEVGRYYACSDPSRTSVDLQGNVYVACRGDGRVMKIMSLKKNCIDKNGNGVIETSEDKDGSKTISQNEMVQNDECIKFTVQPGNTNQAARGTGVDKENHVWIGKYDNKLYRLEPENGQVVDSFNIGVGSYGLTIDQKGIIWIQGGGLIRFDPATKTKTTHGSAPGQYGIAVDKFGKIWVGSYSVGASRYDPITGQWQQVPGVPQASGIAATNDGFVWTANDSCGCVGKIDAVQMKFLGTVKIGGSPHGIAVDFDGFIWGVNWGGHTASKVDPIKMIMIGDYPVGNNPYTYSDMIGSSANWFAAPKGFYMHTFISGNISNPVQRGTTTQLWLSISVEAELPEVTSLKIRFRAADTVALLENANWTEDVSFPPETFPYDITKYNLIGKMMQVDIQLLTKENGVTPILKSILAKSKAQ